MSRSADWLLRLDAEAWTLHGGAGALRQPHDGAPAAALAALAAEVRGGGARLRVVLGDGWLRYLVLHWPQGVRSKEERAAFMTHRFRAVHELGEPEWAFVLDPDVVGFPALACGAPAELISALQAFARARDLRLGRVVGDFVDCFNGLQRGFDEATGSLAALAVASGPRLTVGLWRDGAWIAVRSRAMGSEGPRELAHMLDGWRAELAPAEEGTLYAVGMVPAVSAGWRVVLREAP